MLKEIVVLSGKGGAGKTSVTAALGAALQNCVMADCDVDASNLPLLCSAKPEGDPQPFSGGKEAVIDPQLCRSCGLCRMKCRFEAIRQSNQPGATGRSAYEVLDDRCEGCGLCARLCPHGAIRMEDRIDGVLLQGRGEYGEMVWASLGSGGENSGKLVAKVREVARDIAKQHNRNLILLDGPPGLGCPVISSLTGSQGVLLVAEASVSGFHDVKRLSGMIQHFGIPSWLCINKADHAPQIVEQIKAYAQEQSIPFLGAIPWDREFVDLQLEGKNISSGTGKGAEAVNAIIDRLQKYI